MNPHSQPILPTSNNDILPQTVQDTSSPGSTTTQPTAGYYNSQVFADPDFVYPPEMPAEPEDDFDNEDSRVHELMLDDHASDTDDFARSDEDGWYYSDDD